MLGHEETLKVKIIFHFPPHNFCCDLRKIDASSVANLNFAFALDEAHTTVISASHSLSMIPAHTRSLSRSFQDESNTSNLPDRQPR
jgi:hypothetical protein